MQGASADEGLGSLWWGSNSGCARAKTEDEDDTSYEALLMLAAQIDPTKANLPIPVVHTIPRTSVRKRALRYRVHGLVAKTRVRNLPWKQWEKGCYMGLLEQWCVSYKIRPPVVFTAQDQSVRFCKNLLFFPMLQLHLLLRNSTVFILSLHVGNVSTGDSWKVGHMSVSVDGDVRHKITWFITENQSSLNSRIY